MSVDVTEAHSFQKGTLTCLRYPFDALEDGDFPSLLDHIEFLVSGITNVSVEQTVTKSGCDTCTLFALVTQETLTSAEKDTVLEVLRPHVERLSRDAPPGVAIKPFVIVMMSQQEHDDRVMEALRVKAARENWSQAEPDEGGFVPIPRGEK